VQVSSPLRRKIICSWTLNFEGENEKVVDDVAIYFETTKLLKNQKVGQDKTKSRFVKAVQGREALLDASVSIRFVHH
jgi:hypothetical protein